MQVSTNPHRLCDYHIIHFRNAEGLFPYLKQPSSVHISSQKNSLKNIQSCFFKTLLRCHPLKPSHSKHSPSNQQIKFCEWRVLGILGITCFRMLQHVLMMGLELFEMTKLFTWRRLSSNLTHANSMAQKLQFTAPVTCCSHKFQQPLTWIYAYENNLENPCLLLGTCQGYAETRVDMLQRVRGWGSLSNLYLAQMKQAKHYLDYVHVTFMWQNEVLLNVRNPHCVNTIRNYATTSLYTTLNILQ